MSEERAGYHAGTTARFERVEHTEPNRTERNTAEPVQVPAAIFYPAKVAAAMFEPPLHERTLRNYTKAAENDPRKVRHSKVNGREISAAYCHEMAADREIMFNEQAVILPDDAVQTKVVAVPRKVAVPRGKPQHATVIDVEGAVRAATEPLVEAQEKLVAQYEARLSDKDKVHASEIARIAEAAREREQAAQQRAEADRAEIERLRAELAKRKPWWRFGAD